MLGNDETSFNVFFLNFAIVGITSSVAKTATAPLDRIKLILQNQSSATHILTGERKRYRNFFDCCIRIPKEQGYKSLWRGNGINVIRYIPNQALNFSFNDLFKGYLSKSQNGNVNSIVSFASGGLAGGASILTMYPLKFCQTRLSLDMGSVKGKQQVPREFNGLIDCFKKICKHEGFLGLYKGLTLAVAAASIYRSMYFGLFDFSKNLYINNTDHYSDKPPVMVQFLIAQTVTVTSGLCIYPLDTISRRLMLESGRKAEYKIFTGPWTAFRIVYVREGMRAFYRGAITNCIRGVCGALILVFYDEFLHYTQWKARISINK